MLKRIFILMVFSCVFGEHDALIQTMEDNTKIRKSSHTHIFKESNSHLSARSDIEKQNRARHDHSHEVVFIIQQKNMDELKSVLHDISDPYSPNYGQHWTRDEVVDFTSNIEGRNAVVSYLHLSGASVVSETLAGEYVTAKASVKIWEKMFNTQIYLFHLKHRDDSIETVIRAENYWIPRELNEHVAGVLNIIEIFDQSSKSPSRIPQSFKIDRFSSTEFGYMTPTKLRAYYNMSRAMGSINSTQVVFASAGQYYSPKNLASFQESEDSPVQAAVREYGNHANDTVCILNEWTCAEGNLDMQYITTMSPLSPTTFWYTDTWLTAWLSEVANSINPPKVLSISYALHEDSLSAAVFIAFDLMAIKLGTMGVTIVVASGDWGAGDRYKCGYNPCYPATSPYVVSVGATIVSQITYLD